MAQAKNKNKVPVKGKVPDKTTVVVNDIRIIAANRNKKSIEGWRTAQRVAEVIVNPNRTLLYDLYDDIIVDGHLSGVIQKRIDAVLNKELFYEDAKGEKVPEMDKLIKTASFRIIARSIMESIFWGVSGIEFIPGRELDFLPIPRKHIKPEYGIISIEQNSLEGFDYINAPYLWVIGDERDLGLLLKCAPYAIYKRDSMADWANYIEIFGQPVRVIKYDANDEQTKIELNQILDESGSSLALMIPRQADFEMQDGKQSNGTGELQATFKDALNAEMSIIVLGNTETTTNGKTGSQAKSKVHSDQQNEIAKSDLTFAEYTFNDPKFISIIKAYGWPVVEGGRFSYTKEIDIAFLEKRILIDKEVAQLVPISHDYFYDTYGIPKPENKQEVTEPMEKKPDPTTDPEDQEDTNLSFNKTTRLRHLVSALKYFFG